MTYRYLTQLAAACRAAGLKVVEVNGWKTRGRPSSTGGFDPVGVLCHHTATNRATSVDNVLTLLVGGRSDLPGPLCQLGLGRDGTVYVVAAGRANHAGTAKSSGTVAAGDGNSLYIGIEAFNDGVGEPWPAVQYEAYVKLCAALCDDVTGNSAQTVRGHKETSVTGKIDPTFDMGAFRERVAKAMREDPDPTHFDLDVCAANMYVKNRNQPRGIGVLADRAEAKLGRRLDVILANEWVTGATEAGIYAVHSRPKSRNAVLLKPWFDDVDVAWVKGSEGEGTGVNKHDRDMAVARYTKRGVKCGAIAFHAPYLGQPRPHRPPIADEYEKYGDVLLEQAAALVREGRVVNVGGDNNSRPGDDGGHWPFAIYRRLDAAGFHVVRQGLDLVATKGATPRRDPLILDLAGTGSNHQAAVVVASKVPPK